MPTCIRKGLELIAQHHGRSLTLATIPAEDPAVYDMLCNADSIGVFQVESRAQMTMLPRLKPRCFYDLVVEVAIVRPGPIVGDMVHPYLRRRNGEELVHYPDETIRKVLGKTLGVPLFQEQVMALAIQAAGFTPGEAEKLRRAITAWTSKSDIAEFPSRFVGGMLRNGYTREFAEWCFQRFKGFSQYGFPESHAASFALLVYASAWIKCYYPAVFAAALLNSQPLGFYAPAQIVRDAQEHGVEARCVDVNRSAWDCTLEENGSVLRLGLRMVDGLRRRDADVIAEAMRRFGPFASVFDLWRASEVSAAALRVLAQADAFRSMRLDRQHALW
ncbi:MAG: error-prone DNA polymerase, partial [Gammaproteobacteria bacterium]